MTTAPAMTETETELRRDLAAVFRAMARLGMTEQIAGHNSMMLPEEATDGEPMFLINPRGLHFSEVRASDLLLCKLDGSVVRGSGELRRVAFHIHARVHLMHPGARCVLHTHPQYLTALSLIEGGRMAFAHQNDMALAERIAYDDAFGGIALTDEEGDRIAEKLGDRTILVMANHGVTVVGPTIHDAFDELYMAEQTCKYQMTAMATGLPLRKLNEQFRMHHRGAWSDYFDARLHLDSWRRRLDREEPDYAQ
ncbi:class II aldolase/adducin family protein [Salipiger thiooxidans]|jgi:ribulose-5-phosphate 4-epimerase/fuculose-1-phosphate aldolase|uniref:class II aldolase/adducin family protein n=1 Tax=Salipiger thiooxidans TaxID=282683 RepID=UPI001CD2475C|nr:class II aldolase/adducin family protein [Salipiger thiooxidans]MCA0849349.1 class II aldolase/adducin family protein [Salipiger thiooxidans]